MGKLFKSGQYGKRFLERAVTRNEPETGDIVSDLPWRQAAQEEIVILIGQRGGLTVAGEFDVADSRSARKKRKSSASPAKNVELFELYKLIADSPQETIHEAAILTARRLRAGEEGNLVKAIASFTADPENISDIDYVLENELSSRPSSMTTGSLVIEDELSIDPNPFNFRVPSVSAGSIEAEGSLPYVPHFADDDPDLIGLQYEIVDDVDEPLAHNRIQQIEKAIYTIGASVINQNPDLLAKYDSFHEIKAEPPTPAELQQQALYVLSVGMYALPKEMLVKKIPKLVSKLQEPWVGRNDLLYPNGASMKDQSAVHDMLNINIQRTKELPSTEIRSFSDGYIGIANHKDVPKLDMDCMENAHIRDFFNPADREHTHTDTFGL